MASALASNIGAIGQGMSGAGSLISSIGSLLPTTTTANFSGATNKRTQQTVFDEDAVKRILDIMMQSTDGLQATTSGEHAAGLFNSSTNQLLVNNLLATVGGEVARLTAPTEVTEELGASQTKTKSKKCFITTAICVHAGLPDDCDELQTLRKFRDTWLSDNHPMDIVKYYNEAPKIVELINAREDAALVWGVFRNTFILPAIKAIKDEEPILAYRIYRALFNEAKNLSGLA